MSSDITIACVKTGTKYSSEYVNKLESMVKRHLKVPFSFLCITDDPTGVNCKTVPVMDDLPGWWAKLTLFAPKPYGIEGKILFLDLDIVILEDLEPFTEPDEFTIIMDWNLPMYNSSVFLLPEGTQTQVWDNFDDVVMQTSKCGDQWWITQAAEGKTWEEGWCTSYRATYRPDGKIVVFHGQPKPHQVNGWVKEHWR